MTAVKRQIGALLLLVSGALGQVNGSTAILQKIEVFQESGGIRVQVTLSAPVAPTLGTAVHPDRLFLEFPNTVPGTAQQISVHFQGVRVVRAGLHRANPAITRVVLELDQPQTYHLDSNGNQVTLRISPATSAAARGRGAPAAAASGGFIGVFRRKQKAPPAVPPAQTVGAVPPAPSFPPIKFPEQQTTASSGAASVSPATAAHPARSSLQQGTVFPESGLPGSGNVPRGQGTDNGKFDIPTTASVSQANRPAISVGAAEPPTTTGNAPAAAALTQSGIGANAESVSPRTAPTTGVAVPPVTAPVPQLPSKPQTPAGQEAVVGPVKSVTAEPSSSASHSPSSTATSSDTSIAVTQAAETGAPRQSTLSSTGANATTGPEASSAPAQVNTETPSGVDAGRADGSSAPAEEANADQPVLAMRASDPNLRTVFKVKYVADGVAYLDGGRSSGLAEGMKLEIKDSEATPEQGTTADPADPRVVAELEVSGIADTSAVTDVHSPKRPVKVGDLAYLSSLDAQNLVQQRTLSATRKYPAVVTFTEGDPMDEELRAEVPRPPLPSVNRARGRIGLDYLGTISHGTQSLSSSDLGVVVRTDITRINGTFWNLSGYWRGRLTSQSAASQQTLQDLINRTYHLSLTYENPNSAWVAGFGRLYLPWAPSLDTIDGGYFGRRISHGTTLGIFGGTTPDPTSYSYNPDQQIGGAFINFEGGDFQKVHYTSTSGVGLSLLSLQINRPFVFFENTISYKNTVSIYDSLQADSPKGSPSVAAPGPGLSRNFLTLRWQVTPRVEVHFNHTYFRDIPTFDPTLIGTGLLDKYLFQGFSAGARVEIVKHISVYGDLGRSSNSTDAKSALNELYGITFDRLPKVGLRADVHYSRFNSSFGSGSYESFSLSRNLTDALRLEVLAGKQNFSSILTNASNSKFLNANIETTLGRNYFLQGGFTTNRGALSYDQWSVTLGYRFDSKGKRQ